MKFEMNKDIFGTTTLPSLRPLSRVVMSFAHISTECNSDFVPFPEEFGALINERPEQRARIDSV